MHRMQYEFSMFARPFWKRIGGEENIKKIKYSSAMGDSSRRICPNDEYSSRNQNIEF